MKHYLAAAFLCVTQSIAAQPYDSIVGESRKLGTPDEHWFSARGSEIAYLINGDEGSVEATLTLSMFSPAIEPHLDAGRIYSYGSFYTRTFYGDRTDVVLVFDLENALPIKEIEIPPKSAGIGHSGMIGLIEERFIGVWNITPAMSVSVVDTSDDRFVGEISTPGCAGVYPVDAGFLMACGDGRIQYIRLDSVGEEVDRLRSESFFSMSDDPVFDYAVPTPEGWMFMSLEGMVYEVSVANGAVQISEPWSINPEDIEDAADLNGVPIEADDDWRIGGRQAFAYNASANLLVTLMHQGGGQETFEDPGTQVWAFSTQTRRRAYVLELDEETMGSSLELTADDEPLLLIAPADGGELLIHDALSSRLLRTVPEINASMIQRLE
ncbi:amine dehydrogenase large subunit [Congregibacter brevis]|uniref:Amine dehydrogenase large subunit n=1 Tax=Congregibacter brevis TaxID=3081201 RepID=A0ABZ0IEQ4_9GAMM|nr:amine dehydrogenase large subunit [Congregibacter sp. IMCC45268]